MRCRACFSLQKQFVFDGSRCRLYGWSCLYLLFFLLHSRWVLLFIGKWRSWMSSQRCLSAGSLVRANCNMDGVCFQNVKSSWKYIFKANVGLTIISSQNIRQLKDISLLAAHDTVCKIIMTAGWRSHGTVNSIGVRIWILHARGHALNSPCSIHMYRAAVWPVDLKSVCCEASGLRSCRWRERS